MTDETAGRALLCRLGSYRSDFLFRSRCLHQKLQLYRSCSHMRELSGDASCRTRLLTRLRDCTFSSKLHFGLCPGPDTMAPPEEEMPGEDASIRARECSFGASATFKARLPGILQHPNSSYCFHLLRMANDTCDLREQERRDRFRMNLHCICLCGGSWYTTQRFGLLVRHIRSAIEAG